MLEPPGSSLRRLALILALVVAVLVQVYALVHAVHAQAQRRDRVVREERRAIQALASALGPALGSGDPERARAALREAFPISGAAEIEIRDRAGKPILAYPAPAPVRHWPSAGELTRLGGGGVLTVGPIGAGPGRVLSYVVVRVAGDLDLLRVAREAPELLTGLHDGQRLLMVHGAALVVLLLATSLVLFRGQEWTAPPSRALHAYEQAMDWLHARGQELASQHQAERRVLQAHIEDQGAMARAGELTAGIVHEIRNGLATIVAHAKLLESEPAAAASAAAIREECGTLGGVIRRFMEFVKQEHLNVAPVSLARLLERAAARESRGRPGAAVSVALAPGHDDALAGDEALLERAFENIIRNAREAAGPGGHVRVTLERDGARQRVGIADDGPGLPPEARAGSVRPFVTTKPGGLGLGLAIAAKMVGLHGGSLAFADNSPHGLVVTVTLPVARPAADPDVTKGGSAAATSGVRGAE